MCLWRRVPRAKYLLFLTHPRHLQPGQVPPPSLPAASPHPSASPANTHPVHSHCCLAWSPLIAPAFSHRRGPVLHTAARRHTISTSPQLRAPDPVAGRAPPSDATRPVTLLHQLVFFIFWPCSVNGCLSSHSCDHPFHPPVFPQTPCACHPSHSHLLSSAEPFSVPENASFM